MTMADLIPTMADADLVSLNGNAQRLEITGTAKQQRDAAELLPLIAAEIADRKAKAPPKAAAQDARAQEGRGRRSRDGRGRARARRMTSAK